MRQLQLAAINREAFLQSKERANNMRRLPQKLKEGEEVNLKQRIQSTIMNQLIGDNQLATLVFPSTLYNGAQMVVA